MMRCLGQKVLIFLVEYQKLISVIFFLCSSISDVFCKLLSDVILLAAADMIVTRWIFLGISVEERLLSWAPETSSARRLQDRPAAVGQQHFHRIMWLGEMEMRSSRILSLVGDKVKQLKEIVITRQGLFQSRDTAGKV